jgi:hypothetical protein
LKINLRSNIFLFLQGIINPNPATSIRLYLGEKRLKDPFFEHLMNEYQLRYIDMAGKNVRSYECGLETSIMR